MHWICTFEHQCCSFTNE